jgi:hypothetical protein
MKTRADKTQENKSQSVTNAVSRKIDGESASQFFDDRPEAIAQRKLKEMANNSSQLLRLRTIQEMADNHSAQQSLIQKKENKTGLPDNLKSGIENLSGYSLDDVKVHYNSDKPAGLQAHAYTQGTDIHLASGQEKHLPHEAWHIVQQMQGRVKPTMQMKGVEINDEQGLESEADVMGTKALQMKRSEHITTNSTPLRRKKGDASPFPASHIFDPLAHPQEIKTPGNNRSTIMQAKGVVQRVTATPNGETIYYLGDKPLYTIDGQAGVFVKSPAKSGVKTVYRKVVNTGEKALNGKDKYKLADPAVNVEIDERTLKQRLQAIGEFGDNYLVVPSGAYPHLSVAYTENEGVITLGDAHYSRRHDDGRRLDYKRSAEGWTYQADIKGLFHEETKAAADAAIKKVKDAL